MALFGVVVGNVRGKNLLKGFCQYGADGVARGKVSNPQQRAVVRENIQYRIVFRVGADVEINRHEIRIGRDREG